MAELIRGHVKWFNDAKGFGFIEHSNTGKDVFVHYSVVESDGFKTLKDGEEVDYELHEGDKGLHASRVVRLSKALSEEAEQQSVKSEACEQGEDSDGKVVAKPIASEIEREADGTSESEFPVTPSIAQPDEKVVS